MLVGPLLTTAVAQWTDLPADCGECTETAAECSSGEGDICCAPLLSAETATSEDQRSSSAADDDCCPEGCKRCTSPCCGGVAVTGAAAQSPFDLAPVNRIPTFGATAIPLPDPESIDRPPRS